jgi:hypothetical protein
MNRILPYAFALVELPIKHYNLLYNTYLDKDNQAVVIVFKKIEDMIKANFEEYEIEIKKSKCFNYNIETDTFIHYVFSIPDYAVCFFPLLISTQVSKLPEYFKKQVLSTIKNSILSDQYYIKVKQVLYKEKELKELKEKELWMRIPSNCELLQKFGDNEFININNI